MKNAFRYMKNADAIRVVLDDWVEFRNFIGILGELEGVATDPAEGAMVAIAGPHLVVKKIKGVLCIRDKNPNDVPLVTDTWFQVPDECPHSSSPTCDQAPCREVLDTQIDDRSFLRKIPQSLRKWILSKLNPLTKFP